MSSIFGQIKPASNLYGNTNNFIQSQSAPTSALSGNTSQPQPQSTGQTGGFFGSLGASKTQSQSSLFPNLAGNQNPNPLASIGTSQPQQQTTSGGGGLFRTIPAVGSQPQQAQNNVATTHPVASSFFAPQQHQQQPQNTQLEQAGQGQQQQQDVQNIQGAAKAPQPAYFDNLLERGKKRTHDADRGPGFSDLPSLQLGLSDIAKQVRELGRSGARTQRGKVADSRS